MFETTGGSFDNPEPVTTAKVGAMKIDFSDCSNAQLTYSLTNTGAEGDISVTRVVPPGNAVCEAISETQ